MTHIDSVVIQSAFLRAQTSACRRRKNKLVSKRKARPAQGQLKALGLATAHDHFPMPRPGPHLPEMPPPCAVLLLCARGCSINPLPRSRSSSWSWHPAYRRAPSSSADNLAR